MMTYGTCAAATIRSIDGSASPPLTSFTIVAPASSADSATVGPHGVDADHHAGRGELAHDRGAPAQLLLEGHALSPRSGGLAADIDQVGSLRGKLPAVRDRRLRVEPSATVGERVRSHVEDPMTRQRR